MEKDRLKILFITLEYGKEISGGIGRVVNSLTPFIEEKIDLHIMLIRNLRIIKYTRLYRIRNHQWTPKICGHFHPKLLIGLINKEKYDAIHLFHVATTCAEAVKTIKEIFPQIKIIYSCHSIAKYESNIRNNHPNLLRYEDTIINHADHIHLLNQSSLKYLKASYGPIADKKSYSIIPNGIAEDSFQKKDARFDRKMNRLLNKNGKITVLCMSRWSWGKGLEYLFDAIPKVVSQYKNVQFIITGRRLISWEHKYFNYLWKINSRITTLKDYIIPLGWLNDGQRNSLFAYADIWVMPSLLEYFPYSILEPMIAGIPIVSSRIDSVCEMLNDNEDCLFFEPKNPNQLADKILTLIQNPVLRKEMADNAYHKAKKYYPWVDISDMYMKMYHTAINKPFKVTP